MDRTVLNPPDELPHNKAARSALLRVGRWVFLGVALGILAWRLGMDGRGALDAAQKIDLSAVFGSFLAAAAQTGLLRPVQR